MRTCFISSFPSDGPDPLGRGGLAWYTRNLVNSLAERSEGTFVVLAQGSGPVEVLGARKGRVIVDRCWKGRLLDVFMLLSKVRAYNPDLVHIQHEFFMFGGFSSLLLVPLLILGLKLHGKPILVTLHGVVAHHELERGLLAPESGVGPSIAALVLRLLLRSVSSYTSAVIVHDEYFKEVLVGEYRFLASKLLALPLGIDQPLEMVSKEHAKNLLGLDGQKIILFFGYIAPYKGVENLLRAFQIQLETSRDLTLILAGGEHPRLAQQDWYREYIRRLKAEAGKLGDRVVLTGYVPDGQLAAYFSAADVVAVPYKHVISMSGPLCIALAYEKPVVVPDVPPFCEMFRGTQALFVPDDCADMAEKIHLILTDSPARESLIRCARRLKAERSWPTIAEKTENLYQSLLRNRPQGGTS